MANFRLTILIMQDVRRCYTVDIIKRLIYQGYVPDKEEGQGFYKLNVVDWRRMYVFFSVCRVAPS